jgi:ribosomal protein L35AE/L33A
MHVLRIEHHVPDFDRWKKAFDDDPVGREKAGVRRYRVLRAVDDPNYAMIDLEFDSTDEAEAMLATLRVLWGRVQGNIMTGPQARIVEVVETVSY